MVRTSLVVLAALLAAAPLAAQEERVWSAASPDGHTPLDIRDGRALERGQLQVTYRFSDLDDRGVWFDDDSLRLSETLEFYEVAPLSQNNVSHEVEVAYGVTDALTLAGRVSYHLLERRSQTADDVLYITEADALGDLEVAAVYNLYRQGPYTASARAGVVLPTGEERPTAVTPFSAPNAEVLAYDMRPGSGVFAALPGATAQVQNEHGSVGARVEGRLHFGTNDSGFTPGDRLSLTGWAAYRINEAFSVSARLAYESWGRVEGADPDLDPLRDPSHDGFFAEGSRTSIPVGVNFVMPQGSPLAGYRLSVEYMQPIAQDFEGPQLGFSRGLVVGLRTAF